MEKQLGFLRIKVQRGINLAVRDRTTSDPYVIVRMGKQKLQTRVVKKTLNPEWNEDLTFAIADARGEEDPNLPIRLEVYDWDAFFDDKMGDVEIETKPFFKAVKMHSGDPPSGSVIIRVKPTHKNRLAEQSLIVWKDSKVVQNMILKLCNVECGKVVLQLQWIGKKLS